MRLRALLHERENGGGESCSERPRFDRADVSVLESSKGLSCYIIIAARLHRVQPLAEAGKRESVVSHGSDVMLGLPDTAAFDASARVDRVDDAPSEDVPCNRRRG